MAGAREPSFELGDENSGAVARVCRRLDGLPLAIKLAGARIGLLAVPELADRLSESLDALGTGPRDVPARQRTLRATLEWSHQLLTPDERAALAASPCSRAAAPSMPYEAIDGLAGVAAARGEDELAATLLAAAEATGPERHSGELARQLEQRYFAPARIRLGEQAWRAASAAGAAMTLREAIDAALSVPQVAAPAGG